MAFDSNIPTSYFLNGNTLKEPFCQSITFHTTFLRHNLFYRGSFNIKFNLHKNNQAFYAAARHNEGKNISKNFTILSSL